MKKPSSSPPICPVCGASLPHNNPMAWQFHYMQVPKQKWAEVDKVRFQGESQKKEKK